MEELERIERYKGIAFVAVTGLGLFLVAYLVLRKQLADADEAMRARETLLKSERNALAGLFVSSIAHDANNITMVVSSTLELLTPDPGVDGAEPRGAGGRAERHGHADQALQRPQGDGARPQLEGARRARPAARRSSASSRCCAATAR